VTVRSHVNCCDTPADIRAITGYRWHGRGVRATDNRCLTCGKPTVFERPPCGDEHGADCPERVCTRCGAALLVGTWPPAPRKRTRPVKARARAA
jgi:hypothetical protein